MRPVKCGLAPLVQTAACLDFFEGVARRAHEAKTAAYLLCKLSLLEAHERAEPLPRGKGALVSLFKDCLSIVGGGGGDADSTTQRRRLRALCDDAFPPGFRASTAGFCNWPTYASDAYSAQVVEHIRRCYPACLERYLGSTLGMERGHALTALAKTVMCKEATPHVPPAEAALLVPARALLKGYAKYDVKCAETALDYLPCMLHMAAHLERAGEKGYAVLPLVSSQVPAAVFIDTATLIDLLPGAFLDGASKQHFKTAWRTANPTGKRGRISDKHFTDAEWARKQARLHDGQAALWEKVLRLDRLPLRAWCFDNRIQTDGVSVTLYARRPGEHLLKQPKEYPQHAKEHYVQHLARAARAPLRARPTLVSIDPGKQNIIYAVEVASVAHAPGQVTAPRTLTYTAKQRAFELRKAQARAWAAAFRGISPIDITAWEARLAAAPPRRTLDPAALRLHIAAFYTYADATRPFWLDRFHRAQRLDAYRRQQRSEARLMKAFAQTFGPADDVVVAFGDGARNSLQGRAPGPSTAIRTLLQRHHYAVVDIREAYTSKRCFACKRPDAENAACRVDRKTGRPAWGVRRCNRCGTSWARDFHACLNIDRLAREHLAGLTRPDYLTVRA